MAENRGLGARRRRRRREQRHCGWGQGLGANGRGCRASGEAHKLDQAYICVHGGLRSAVRVGAAVVSTHSLRPGSVLFIHTDQLICLISRA